MRVIAGEFKGRTIDTVSNQLTRPTADKVKESLFNIIGPFFNGGIVLDLFAGSGGLGIEALSRGMEQAVFIDQQTKAIQIIKKNLKQLQLENRAEVYQNDALRSLKVLGKREITFDLIFVDPPYKNDIYQQTLELIEKEALANGQTIIVCEHESNQNLPDSVGIFTKTKSRKYGQTTLITLYQKKEEFNE